MLMYFSIKIITANTSVKFSADLLGKEPLRQVGDDRVLALRNLGCEMVGILAREWQ